MVMVRYFDSQQHGYWTMYTFNCCQFAKNIQYAKYKRTVVHILVNLNALLVQAGLKCILFTMPFKLGRWIKV
jgi:hypothetical protein